MKPYPLLLYALSRLRWRLTRPVTLGVRLLLIMDRSVLLVRHTYQPYWFLVGGGVKRRETLLDAARREAAEEVGAQMGELRLHGVFTNFFDYKSDHVVVFVCTEFTLTDRSDHEIEKRAFFPFDALPDDIAAGHRRRIGEYTGGQTGAMVELW